MAAILITGNTGLLTPELLDTLSEEYKVVVTAEEGQEDCAGKDKNLHVYVTNPMKKQFRQLFDAYGFEAVWYLSGFADGGDGRFGEMEWLERIFSCCKESGVEKLILLSTTESRNFYERTGRNGEHLGREYLTRKAFAAAQMEESGEYFARNTDTRLITLWCPYLAGKMNESQYLGGLFKRIFEKKRILLPYAAGEPMDVLSMRDLGRLILQILQETEDGSGRYFAVSGYRHTWRDLEERLKEIFPQAEIGFEQQHMEANIPEYPYELRRRYGFIPRDDVLADLEEYYGIFADEIMNQNESVLQRAGRKMFSLFQGSLKYIELFLVFFFAEFLSQYTAESVYFKVLDIRLLYIVIMGLLYGVRLGVAAAVLECLVLIKRYGEIGISAVVLFYNIENWIPFVFYLMAGFIIGHISDKKSSELAFAKQEMELLKDKYGFLNKVYTGVLDNRREYRRQILGFQDSFGKIFEAVQKLDSEMVGSIFVKGLQVMEEILHSHSIAIYTLDSWQKFGRLAVCSNSMLPKLTKSLRVEDVRELYDAVLRGEVYYNSEFKEGFPVYGCGVLREGRIAFLVLIWEADASQYGMYYMNLFRILCGLVQTSFLRAMDYEEFKRTEDYYEGTVIARPEYFKRNYQIQEDMKDAGISDYVLVKFESKDKAELGERLTGMIRATDLLGSDENGNLYLVLTQTKAENFGIVGKRLEERNIGYEIVRKVG